MYEFEYSLTWKIYNFAFCQHGLLSHNTQLNLPVISDNLLSDDLGHVGRFILYPIGYGDRYSNFVSFFLRLAKNHIKFQKCEIKAIGASGKTLKTHELNKFVPFRDLHSSSIELVCLDFVAIKDVVKDAENSREDTFTICCKLFGTNENLNVSEERFTCTEVGVDRHTFVIKINAGKTVTHSINYNSKSKYDLSITETLGDLKVAFSKQDDNKHLYIDCTFTLLLSDANNKTKKYSETVKHGEFKELKWEFLLKVLSREYKAYITQCQSGNWKPNAYIHCELNSLNGLHFHLDTSKNDSICTPKDAILPLPITATKVLSHSSLQENLQTLFNNKNLSDVKLLVEDETIEAHKNILIARSPVFAVMFDHQDMTEASKGIINIVDIDAHTLKIFLQFLYTDAVDKMDYVIATNLMMAAEKYQVLSLKEKCAMFLRNEMSVDNVCEMLSLADAVSHENLKSTAVEYIVSNSATILSSPQWSAWMKNNMDSATLILSKLTLIHSSTTTNASGMN